MFLNECCNTLECLFGTSNYKTWWRVTDWCSKAAPLTSFPLQDGINVGQHVLLKWFFKTPIMETNHTVVSYHISTGKLNNNKGKGEEGSVFWGAVRKQTEICGLVAKNRHSVSLGEQQALYTIFFPGVSFFVAIQNHSNVFQSSASLFCALSSPPSRKEQHSGTLIEEQIG